MTNESSRAGRLSDDEVRGRSVRAGGMRSPGLETDSASLPPTTATTARAPAGTPSGRIGEAVTALGMTGAAFTNNDLDAAAATSLFDIDTTNDRVSLQSPANAGTSPRSATSA